MNETEDRKAVEPADTWAASKDETKTASHAGVYVFGVSLFAIVCAVLFLALKNTVGWVIALAIGAVAGLLAIMTFRICPQWERVTILKLGKFDRVAGPGLYIVVPIIESAAISVDQRIRTSAFSAEEVLTADLVPVDVDAIIFWMVWDPKKACLEVENYPRAVMWSAQTALRDAIGIINLSDLSMRRKSIDVNLEKILTEKCEAWGITVLSVEIRDISIPRDLQDSLSKEAQAEREKNARVILAEVEKNISEMMVDAAEPYVGNPEAMQLRSFSLMQDIARKGNSFVVVPNAVANTIVPANGTLPSAPSADADAHQA